MVTKDLLKIYYVEFTQTVHKDYIPKRFVIISKTNFI